MLFRGLRNFINERKAGHLAVVQSDGIDFTPSEKAQSTARDQECNRILSYANQSRLYAYHIKMDGSGYAYHIVGDQPLNLRAAVTSAMRSMRDRDFVDQADVLLAIVNKVCEQTGFVIVEVDGRLNIERMYWRESERRSAATDPASKTPGWQDPDL